MKIARKGGERVTLETVQGRKQEFDIEHAERILRTPESGWRLPKDSIYQFDYYDGIEKRRNTKED